MGQEMYSTEKLSLWLSNRKSVALCKWVPHVGIKGLRPQRDPNNSLLIAREIGMPVSRKL